MADEMTRWLTEHAIPLRSLTAGAPRDDLKPLTEVLAGVRIVGLGEATHGSREFFQLKHRLLEFLVTELGFTVLAMEASASAAEAVNDHVLHGTGDAATVLGRLRFWTWNTREVLEMIEWMRAYNRDAPAEARVRFAGIDPQRCAASTSVVESFLSEVAPERLAAVHATLDDLAAARPGDRSDDRSRLTGQAGELLEFLRRNATELAERTSSERFGDALRHARVLTQAADLATRPLRHPDPEQTVSTARDRYMADNVGRIADAGRGKVAVWAHNGHIMTGHYGGGVPAMGRHLRERYGDAYYALGLLFGKGAFRARRSRRARPGTGPVTRFRVGAGGAMSVEARLSAATPGDHLIDLRAGRGVRAVDEWSRERHFHRSFGAEASRLTARFSAMPAVPAEAYDGFAYIVETTCSQPLPEPAA